MMIIISQKMIIIIVTYVFPVSHERKLFKYFGTMLQVFIRIQVLSLTRIFVISCTLNVYQGKVGWNKVGF
jgi:hypothetical protein